MEHFFAPCPRGLEGLLEAELTGLGAKDLLRAPGGVAFSGDWAVCYRANLHSRLASRILWRVSRAPYRKDKAEEEIYRQAFSVPWERHFSLRETFRVQTTASHSPVKSVNFITLRVKDAICDRFRNASGKRPDVDTANPGARVQVYLSGRECIFYLDTSGNPLWQRGQRQARVEAPLKENLAAGILKLSGWQPGVPLLDPMCGGGTFLLEAASIALNHAPGLDRPVFGFERLLGFDSVLWQRLRAEALSAVRESSFPLSICGGDVDARAAEAARRNLKAAGLEKAVVIKKRDFAGLDESDWPERGRAGILLANPPYGERVGEYERLPELYAAMSATLKRHFAGWRAAFLSADPDFSRLLRLKPARKTPLFNGALECRLYEFDIVAGSNRK
ncbi:MAG: THUMP domain-containing protein [Zoogloeaceae bacterium]|jgi:putative N6-adenine-specific DNA methylase|nr:THUMP domain-containing protein [Zoogloeaceae bacterium]